MYDFEDTACALSGLCPVSLTDLAAEAARLDGVRKEILCFGDRVVVTTRNSVYTLDALEDGRFAVSGGWFDREGPSPTVVDVNGCTWGGRAINQELVAAPGLFMEFGNGVVTTRIQRVAVTRRGADLPVH